MGKRGRQPRMIEGRRACVLLRVHQDKLRPTGAGFSIAKLISLFDPVRRYFADVDKMSQIPRLEPLCPLIIFQVSLPENCWRNCQKEKRNDRWSRKSLHLTSVLA